MNDFNSNSVRNRVELHLHTNMSAMNAVSPAADLIRRACAWGHKAVAITDQGGVQAFPEVMNTIEELRREGKNIKPIYGMEAYFVNDSDGTDFKKLPIFHIIILVKNKQGLKNLYKLVSLSHTKYFYRNPIITMSELQNHREGLIIGSVCGMGEIFRAVFENKQPEYIKKIAKIYDYFEIQPVENNKHLIKEGNASSKDEICAIFRTCG